MTVCAGESGGCDESESCCFVVKQKRWHLHKVVRHFKMSVTGNTLQPVFPAAAVLLIVYTTKLKMS